MASQVLEDFMFVPKKMEGRVSKTYKNIKGAVLRKAKCKHKGEEVTYSNEPFGIRQTCAVKGDGLQPYVTPFNEVRQFGFFNTCTEFD